MSWNNVIPVDLLIEIARKEGAYNQQTLIETPPEFRLNEKYLVDVTIEYDWINEHGQHGGIMYRVDHPAFTALREKLGATGYINIQSAWSNGDRVLKPFLLNGVRFEPGDQFSCAGAMSFFLRHRHEEMLMKLWVAEGRDPAMFPKPGKITEEDMQWATAVAGRTRKEIDPDACCDNEQRNINGGCDNCGDPCL